MNKNKNYEHFMSFVYPVFMVLLNVTNLIINIFIKTKPEKSVVIIKSEIQRQINVVKEVEFWKQH